jgi:origin recognition complex subunit 3
MCHFYANPLSVLFQGPNDTQYSSKRLSMLQADHLEAVRMLPSFRNRIEHLLDGGELVRAKQLLSSDESLLKEIQEALYGEHNGRNAVITKILRDLKLLHATSSVTVDATELYVAAFSGTMNGTDVIPNLSGSVKRMSVLELEGLLETFIRTIAAGDHESGLEPWDNNGTDPFMAELSQRLIKITSLKESAESEGAILRSKYAMHNTSLRTTVIAQKVQLSKAQSALSKMDVEFTELIDDICDLLEKHFVFENPQDMFLNEIWLYDSRSPHREVFTPRPRQALERALCVPHDYLGCTCCKASEEGLSASQSPTAILYQLYLETGGLINVFDLWSAFYAIVGGEDGEDRDERSTLMLFYRALADLKLSGMVKPSRKKTDHLAKMAWKGL